MKTLCLIGETGVGKSSLGNLLSGNLGIFQVFSGIDPGTDKTISKTVKWRGSGEIFTLIDTPGLGDPKGRDSQHISGMVDFLQQIENVNAFLLVVNSQEPRLNEYTRANIQILTGIFGAEFFDHVVLVFTRWSYDTKTEQRRERSGESKYKKQTEICAFLQQRNCLTKTLPAVFIDNYPDTQDPSEMTKVTAEVERLKDMAFSMSDFCCINIKKKRAQLDQLRVQQEQERQRREAEEQRAKIEKERLEQEKKRSEEQARQQQMEIERQRAQQDREDEEKEEQRRAQAKRIFAEKESLGKLSSSDWTEVTFRYGKVPTTRPDKVKCGPGDMVTIEPGGNIAMPGLFGIQLDAPNGVVMKDFSSIQLFPGMR